MYIDNTTSSLSLYLKDIKKYQFLSIEEEYSLAKRYHEKNDTLAAHKLITSHLKLVVKIARQFLKYGCSIDDLISQGNIGLMKAVKGFDPDKGSRFGTYAIWWIKSEMFKFILESFSLTKLSLTREQKRVFFNLRRIKNKLQIPSNITLNIKQSKEIAKKLAVSERDVIEIDSVMSISNIFIDATDDEGHDNSDLLTDLSDNQEIKLIEFKEQQSKNKLLEQAINKLNDREKLIIKERRLKERPATLDELSKIYNISGERVRQIENIAFKKLQKIMIYDNIKKAA